MVVGENELIEQKQLYHISKSLQKRTLYLYENEENTKISFSVHGMLFLKQYFHRLNDVIEILGLTSSGY